MNGEEARRRFAAAAVARLATIRPDGSPHLVPITFVVAPSGDVVTAVDAKPKTTRDLARLANVDHEPRVSVLADHYADEWWRLWWVRCDGRASVVDLAESWLPLFTAKYHQYRERPPVGPAISITPLRWRWWAAAGMPPISAASEG